MKSLWVMFSMMLLVTISCSSGKERRIPPGTYRAQSRQESITVTQSDLEFKISVRRGGDGNGVINRKYKYSLDDDGIIAVMGSSNDSAFVFGILDSDWMFDGKNIVRKDFEVKANFERGAELRSVTYAPDVASNK
jgi:hypothetical protein